MFFLLRDLSEYEYFNSLALQHSELLFRELYDAPIRYHVDSQTFWIHEDLLLMCQLCMMIFLFLYSSDHAMLFVAELVMA